jgi:hypothetical protein
MAFVRVSDRVASLARGAKARVRLWESRSVFVIGEAVEDSRWIDLWLFSRTAEGVAAALRAIGKFVGRSEMADHVIRAFETSTGPHGCPVQMSFQTQ